MANKIRLYKVWQSSESEGTIMYLWGRDMDDAFFNKGRVLDPKCTSCQWTGKESIFNENFSR